MARESSGVRERILDAAVELLRSQGARALSQPQVAKAAGVLQSHLTYYFPKRTDLMLAVARHSSEAVVGELKDFLASNAFPSADAGVREQVLSLVKLLAKNRERTRTLLALMVEADDDPALKAVMVENAGFIRGLVALAMRRSLEDPDVDIALATLWGLGLQHFLFAETRDEAYTDALLARMTVWLANAPSPDPEGPTRTRSI